MARFPKAVQYDCCSANPFSVSHAAACQNSDRLTREIQTPRLSHYAKAELIEGIEIVGWDGAGG